MARGADGSIKPGAKRSGTRGGVKEGARARGAGDSRFDLGLSPASQLRKEINIHAILGLPPQALCSRPLRGLQKLYGSRPHRGLTDVPRLRLCRLPCGKPMAYRLVLFFFEATPWPELLRKIREVEA